MLVRTAVALNQLPLEIDADSQIVNQAVRLKNVLCYGLLTLHTVA